MTAYRCAVASLRRHEPLFATASRVDRWLLVEHGSAWSAETVPRFKLDGAVVDTLERLARRAQARLLLVRRPGRASNTGRRLFFADSRPGREALATREVRRDEDLLDLELPSAAPQAWSAPPHRLLLVCTHGRHDPCCAIWGRPVADALAARYPAETWECTHIGGDRFAPNLVVLPEGYYFGRVLPAEAAGIVTALASGRLVGGSLRGRSSLSLPAQAAQYFARATLNNEDAGDLAPLTVRRVGESSFEVLLGLAARGEVAVTVRRVLPPLAHRLTCHASESRRAPAYELVDLSTG